MENYQFWLQIGVYVIVNAIIIHFLRQKNISLEATVKNLTNTMNAHKEFSDSAMAQMKTVNDSLRFFPEYMKNVPEILDGMEKMFEKKKKQLEEDKQNENNLEQMQNIEKVLHELNELKSVAMTLNTGMNQMSKTVTSVAKDIEGLHIYNTSNYPLNPLLDAFSFKESGPINWGLEMLRPHDLLSVHSPVFQFSNPSVFNYDNIVTNNEPYKDLTSSDEKPKDPPKGY